MIFDRLYYTPHMITHHILLTSQLPTRIYSQFSFLPFHKKNLQEIVATKVVVTTYRGRATLWMEGLARPE